MKSQDVDSEFLVDMEVIRKELRGISISGAIELFYLIKNPLYGIIRYRKERGASPLRMCLFLGKSSLALLKFFLARVSCLLSRRDIPEITGKYVFVVDHPYAKDIKFQERILSHFDLTTVTILTESPHVKGQLSGVYAARLFAADSMINHVSLSRSDYVLWLRVIAKVRLAGVMFLPYLALPILQAILYVRLYESILNTRCTKAVVTHADNHLHEYAITSVASAKGIRTYTNQHGLISHLFAPVISGTIFVWGDVFKRQLCAMGVPTHKIVPVGRVLQPQVSSPLHRSIARAPGCLFERREFDSDRLTVAYFATDYGTHENRELFKTFSAVLPLPINVLIRPRPAAHPRVLEQYAGWVRDYAGEVKAGVVISNDEHFDEVLEQIDVLVTCHSGSVLDGMAYGVVGVILDLFEHMNLATNLPYYWDAIVCDGAPSLRSTIEAMALDRDHLHRLKMQTFGNSRKYFDLLPGRNPDERIAEFIQRA